jgi:cyclopropane-fatty-acyl-phospholipid synthase
MFAVFLGKDMTYSSAIFDDIDGDLRVSHTTSEQTAKDPRENSHIDELHEAQMRKYKFVMQRADIKPHHRVLEIGSGRFPFNFSLGTSTYCGIFCE